MSCLTAPTSYLTAPTCPTSLPPASRLAVPQRHASLPPASRFAAPTSYLTAPRVTPHCLQRHASLPPESRLTASSVTLRCPHILPHCPQSHASLPPESRLTASSVTLRCPHILPHCPQSHASLPPCVTLRCLHYRWGIHKTSARLWSVETPRRDISASWGLRHHTEPEHAHYRPGNRDPSHYRYQRQHAYDGQGRCLDTCLDTLSYAI